LDIKAECQTLHLTYEKRLSAVESSIRSAHHRIDEIQENNKILMEMNGNIKILAEQNKGLNEKIGKVEKNLDNVQGDVSTLKEKPGKRYDEIVGALIVALTGATVGSIFTYLLKK